MSAAGARPPAREQAIRQRRRRGPEGGDGAGTYRVGRVLLVLEFGIVQVLSTLHTPQRVGLGAGTQTALRGLALGSPAGAGAPVLLPRWRFTLEDTTVLVRAIFFSVLRTKHKMV